MKYLTNSGLSYFLNKIKAYLTSSTYLNSIGISNSEIDNIADDAGYSSGSLPASEDIFITGDIIPNTDNSVDLGASSKNIKMIYTKGITINGTQFLPSDYVNLTGAQTIGGNKDFSGTTNIQSLTINGTACGDILTHNVSEFVPRSGGPVMAGPTLSRTVDNDELRFDGGTWYDNGASLSLSGKDRTNANGFATLHTTDGTNKSELLFTPNGTFTRNVNGTVKNIAMYQDVIPRSGGAVMTGSFLGVSSTVAQKNLMVCGGDERNHGGDILLLGTSVSFNPGAICIIPQVGNGLERYMWLHPNGTWTWDGTACQITSDQRYKQQINAIDDKLLDAWEDVNLVQFKYNDAVDQKGKDNARLHTGYVVQQIDSACKSHNVDISQYGLFCHEEYPEETEEVEVEQADGTKVKETKVIREASEHYSLRYTEVYAVECMYLRKRIKELEERLEKLEGNSK